MESKIRELSQDPRIYERIRASIAPNVWGMEDVKMGLASLLFGGSTKIFPGDQPSPP